MKTKVQFFRRKTGDIFAYFPTMPHNDSDGTFTSYSHIGQHSPCHPDYLELCKLATRLEFEPLLEELESIGYDDLFIIKPSLKAFKELLRVDEYSSVGPGDRMRMKTWVCFWDWDQGEYGVRSAGYKFACAVLGEPKAQVINQYYDYLFVNGIRPDYARLKEAATDTQRFKIPISLNW